jgi:hypothetical protein
MVPDDRSADRRPRLVGPTPVCLYIGVAQLVALVRGGSREYFEVREHGLVHAGPREISE